MIRSAAEYFVYGSWWVSICAAALTMLSRFGFCEQWLHVPLIIFVMGGTLAIYNLNMLAGLKELRETGTDSLRHRWCIRNEKGLRVTMILGLVMAGISIWFLNPVIWLFMIPATVVAMFYTLPMLKRNEQPVRVREIGLWKIFLIAAVWAGVTVILPAVELYGLQQFQHLPSWQMAVERGVFILGITIPFDIRDLQGDRKKGVRTIPSVIGWKRSILLSEALLVLFLSLILFRSDTTSASFIAYLLSTAITMTLVAYSSPKRSEFFTAFWLEGTMLLQAVCVLFAALML